MLKYNLQFPFWPVGLWKFFKPFFWVFALTDVVSVSVGSLCAEESCPWALPLCWKHLRNWLVLVFFLASLLEASFLCKSRGAQGDLFCLVEEALPDSGSRQQVGGRALAPGAGPAASAPPVTAAQGPLLWWVPLQPHLSLKSRNLLNLMAPVHHILWHSE